MNTEKLFIVVASYLLTSPALATTTIEPARFKPTKNGRSCAEVRAELGEIYRYGHLFGQAESMQLAHMCTEGMYPARQVDVWLPAGSARITIIGS